MELDALLTRRIMHSVNLSHRDRVVDASNMLWSREDYGKEGCLASTQCTATLKFGNFDPGTVTAGRKIGGINDCHSL